MVCGDHGISLLYAGKGLYDNTSNRFSRSAFLTRHLLVSLQADLRLNSNKILNSFRIQIKAFPEKAQLQ
ncbi:hypothetical protein B0I18_110108 [Taibaiella chishuiensis]|uniref:Uncharacterized protein n=1 Tax=Taibaiella chishuiensis TaxID=1434707 RepID=A0A2P8CXZ4_9BACT|nr:hypothetical protein B0I18_110108 [Taibaiella chishuiensis]